VVLLKTLLIAEKPSVARTIAGFLNLSKNKAGYFEDKQFVVSWCMGHLLNIANPDEQDDKWKGKWNIESLPILLNEFELMFCSDAAKKQFYSIKDIIKNEKISKIINICDAEREGELIFRRVYKQLKLSIPMYRIWLTNMNKEPFLNALKNCKPGKDFDSIAEAATARAEADWMVGMTYSRLFSVKANNLISVGRVQSSVLFLLVKRQREIDSFIPKPYWLIKGGPDSAEVFGWVDKSGDNKIWDKAQALEIQKKIKENKGLVTQVKNKEGFTEPPLPFSLSLLQKEMNIAYGFTANDVLNIAQSLYEKHGVITYPRSGCQYISSEDFDKTPSILQELYKINDFETLKDCLEFSSKPKCVNTSKVQESSHTGIVPTGKHIEINSLNTNEKRVYLAICRRFMAALSVSAIYDSSSITVSFSGELMKCSGRTYKKLGWLHAEPSRMAREEVVPAMKQNEYVNFTHVSIGEKKTTPPAYFTDASLLTAMITCGKEIEDDGLSKALESQSGLGTDATRAAIIERVISVKYAERSSNKIVATDKGMRAVSLIEKYTPNILLPEETAKWEVALLEIEKGIKQKSDFLSKIKEQIAQNTKIVADASIEEISDGTNPFKPQQKCVGKCPLCDGDVVKTPKGWGCQNWKSGCKFVIWKEFMHTKLADKDVKELLADKKTSRQLFFKNSNGKEFKAFIKLNEDHKVVFDFDSTSGSYGVCPACGGTVKINSKSYYCEKWKDGCKLSIWKSFMGQTIDAEDVAKLLDGKCTDKKEFLYKNNSYVGRFVLDKEFKISFTREPS